MPESGALAVKTMAMWLARPLAKPFEQFARIECYKQSLMDKHSKRRFWTFKSLRTLETSKGRLHFALRNDHELGHGFLRFRYERSPTGHVVNTTFSVGGAAWGG